MFGINDAISVAVGESACALRAGGTVACWGSNYRGQLGNGTTSSSSTPVAIPSLTGATAISVTGYDACAVLPPHVECWGDNTYGAVGVPGNADTVSTPVVVNGV